MASRILAVLAVEDGMNIGQAAKASGISQRMIRHYEGIGLIPAALRAGSGYRVYSQADVQTLHFIGRARALGFSLEAIETLVRLWRDRTRASADVKALALGHVAELERKIADLTAMKRALQELAAACHGDDRPDCPILDGLGPAAGALVADRRDPAVAPRPAGCGVPVRGASS